MRLISNEELKSVSGGSALLVAGPAAAIAIVSQTEDWASDWGLSFNSFVNESAGGGSFGASGGGSIAAESQNAAIELLNNIRKSVGVDARVTGKIHVDSKGDWSVDVTFDIGGKYDSSKSNGKK